MAAIRHPFSDTLRLEPMDNDPDILRVYSRETDRSLGVLTRGTFTQTGIKKRSKWFVVGHEYQEFKTLAKAIEALRDYTLGYVMHQAAHIALAKSDGVANLTHAKIRNADGKEYRIRLRKRLRRERVRLISKMKRAQEYMSNGHTDLKWN